MDPLSTGETPPARFEIKEYELHVTTYEVEAQSVAEAIKRLFNGDGDAIDVSEYVGTCEQIGMPLEGNPQLAEELRKLGVQVPGSIVPSIRTVRRAHGSKETI